MSTTNSISESLSAYTLHAFGGFAAAYAACRFVQLINQGIAKHNAEQTDNNAKYSLINKYVAPLSSLTAGAAASMLIAWSTKAQNLTMHLLCGAIAGGTRWGLEYTSKSNKQTAWENAEGAFAHITLISLITDILRTRAALDPLRPLMSSPVSIVCGVAGAILGSLASRDPAAGQDKITENIV